MHCVLVAFWHEISVLECMAMDVAAVIELVVASGLNYAITRTVLGVRDKKTI
jgi:hypothetical protein